VRAHGHEAARHVAIPRPVLVQPSLARSLLKLHQDPHQNP